MTNHYYHNAATWNNDLKETYSALHVFSGDHKTFTSAEFAEMRKKHPHILTLQTLRKHGVIFVNGTHYSNKTVKAEVINCPDDFSMLYSDLHTVDYIAFVNKHFSIHTNDFKKAEFLIDCCTDERDWIIQVKNNLYSIDMIKAGELF